MPQHMRTASGDQYAQWEEPKATRQSFAAGVVQTYQRTNPGCSFAYLVDVFRRAGEEFDRWESDRGEAA